MIPIKQGIAVYFPVRIRSIFSLRILSLLSLGFTTVFSQTFSIKVKRISAIAALRSSPRSFSIWTIRCSIASFSFSSRCSFSKIRWSPSMIFEAAKRIGICASFAWSSIRCETAWIQRCTAPPKSLSSQKSCLPGRSWYFAMWSAWRTSSSTPSFFAAEIGTTGTPSIASMPLTSTEPEFPVISSIIFNAMTIGISISKSCMVRYRFRSMFVASMILIIAFGLSSSTKFLETISSLLYGDIE